MADFTDFTDEEKARRLLRPREGDEWPGTWEPDQPAFSFVPKWRNDAGQETRLVERREGEPVAQTTTGDTFRGLTPPEMHDVIVDFMKDNPGGSGGNPNFDRRVEVELGTDLDDLPALAEDLLDIARRGNDRGNTVWIELRVSQGHDYSPAEVSEVSADVENATDVPASRAFCSPEGNLLFCYLRINANRLPIGRLQLFNHELDRVADDWTARTVDEINVVDELVVGERVPEAV